MPNISLRSVTPCAESTFLTPHEFCQKYGAKVKVSLEQQLTSTRLMAPTMLSICSGHHTATAICDIDLCSSIDSSQSLGVRVRARVPNNIQDLTLS